MRLDLALVERGLARSRTHAADLVDSDRVVVDDKPARKPSQPVTESSHIKVLDAIDYVSRAGHKLAAALDEFSEIEVAGKVCLDVGASTGGFTEVLLRRGAKLVVAIDVGHDQMAHELRRNRAVVNLQGFNARELTPETLREKSAELGVTVDVATEPIDLVVGDLSFISLTLVLAQLVEVAPNAEFVLLVKPQFEVGKQSLSASGIVNDHRLRSAAIHQVVACADLLGFGVRGLERSPLPGTHGNQEYLLWINAKGRRNRQEWSDRINLIAREH